MFVCVWGGEATVILAVWGTAIILAVWVGQQSYWLSGLDNSHTGCMGDNSHIDCVCVWGGGGQSYWLWGGGTTVILAVYGGQQSYWLCVGHYQTTFVGTLSYWLCENTVRPAVWEHCHTACVRTLSDN